jgi:hypothetical protein
MAAKKAHKYGSTAGKKVGKAMRERKHGTLRSGGSGKKVTSRKQAVAVGLSEARRRSAKVPAKKKGSRRKRAEAGGCGGAPRRPPAREIDRNANDGRTEERSLQARPRDTTIFVAPLQHRAT